MPLPLESRPETGQEPNLSPLREMVGVKRELEKLIGQGKPLGREIVLGVLETQQLVLAGTRGFDQKAQVLQRIIGELKEHDEVTVESILGAAEINKVKKTVSQNKGLRGLFGHRQ